jgi:P27 family predicted phage terminase small subunit
LPRRARDEWKRITPELEALGLMTVLDLAALTAYCVAFAELEDATRVLEEKGRDCVWPILDKDGDKIGERIRSHPAVQRQRDAMQRVKQFLGEFGLSPSSRTRVSGPGKGGVPPLSPLGELKARVEAARAGRPG